MKLVGFDGASDAIEAMDEAWEHADTAQMLYQMGYQGIKAAADAARSIISSFSAPRHARTSANRSVSAVGGEQQGFEELLQHE